MLSIEKSMQILNQNGKKYTREQAEAILKELYHFAEIEYSNYLNSKDNDKGDNIYQSINR